MPKPALSSAPGSQAKKDPDEVPEQPYEDVQASEEYSEPTASSSKLQFLPAGKRTVWSELEESLVDTTQRGGWTWSTASMSMGAGGT